MEILSLILSGYTFILIKTFLNSTYDLINLILNYLCYFLLTFYGKESVILSSSFKNGDFYGHILWSLESENSIFFLYVYMKKREGEC